MTSTVLAWVNLRFIMEGVCILRVQRELFGCKFFSCFDGGFRLMKILELGQLLSTTHYTNTSSPTPRKFLQASSKPKHRKSHSAFLMSSKLTSLKGITNLPRLPLHHSPSTPLSTIPISQLPVLDKAAIALLRGVSEC